MLMLNILNKIRDMLINHIKKEKITFKSSHNNDSLKLTKDFEIMEMEDCCCAGNGYDIHGVTLVKATEFVNPKQGLKVAKSESVTVDWLKVYFVHNDKKLPIEAIIHTFIHELAHTITLPEKHLSKTVDSKIIKIQPYAKSGKKNSYIAVHHTDEFYRNYSKLLRMCEKLDIYLLPKTHRNFSLSALKRYDIMVNPNDCISLGSSPLFGLIKIE